MEISIKNNPVSFEFVIGADSRTVSKTLIREISLIRDNLLKIDIGGGISGNIYLPLEDIISPAFTDGNDLCGQLNDFLTQTPEQLSNQVSETYTLLGDVKQNVTDTIVLLSDVKRGVTDTYSMLGDVKRNVTDTFTMLGDVQQQASDIYNLLNNVKKDTLFLMPLMRDETNASKIYCGYAPIGTTQSSPNWAILKIFTQSGILSYQWADGNRNFDNVWTDRATLTYL